MTCNKIHAVSLPVYFTRFFADVRRGRFLFAENGIYSKSQSGLHPRPRKGIIPPELLSNTEHQPHFSLNERTPGKKKEE